jgi:hypothetical protein
VKEVTLLFREIDIQETIGEVPKLRFVIDVNIKKFSEVQFSYVQINRISFKVDLDSAKDPSTSVMEWHLATVDSTEPVTVLQEYPAYVEFSIPLNSFVIERMLDIRNRGHSIGFKLSATGAGINYYKNQNRCIISDIWQSQMHVFQNTSAGRIDIILVTRECFHKILNSIGYSKILKIEFPLYLEGSIINDQLRATIDLLLRRRK